MELFVRLDAPFLETVGHVRGRGDPEHGVRKFVDDVHNLLRGGIHPDDCRDPKTMERSELGLVRGNLAEKLFEVEARVPTFGKERNLLVTDLPHAIPSFDKVSFSLVDAPMTRERLVLCPLPRTLRLPERQRGLLSVVRSSEEVCS